MPESSTPATPRLAPQIQDRTAGPGRLLTLRTSVDDVVSFRGSFVANPDFAAGDALRQQLTVSLLDKGTTHRDRFELARVLEACGAKLDLSSDGLFVEASGRALVDDLPRVMDVMAEVLRAPAFDPEEFRKARAQVAADVQRRMEKTSAQASMALSQRLFPDGHPNFTPTPDTVLEWLQDLTVQDVRDYHAAHFGSTEWTLAVVGDLRHEEVASVVDEPGGQHLPGSTDARETVYHDWFLGRDGSVEEGKDLVVQFPLVDEVVVGDRCVQDTAGVERLTVQVQVRVVGVELSAGQQTADTFDPGRLHIVDPLRETGGVVTGGVPARGAGAVHVVLVGGSRSESVCVLTEGVSVSHRPESSAHPTSVYVLSSQL